MKLEFLTAQEWSEFSKDFHGQVFNNPDFCLIERIDFATLVVKDETPIGFATIRELDRASIYLQYGGALQKNDYTNLKGYLLLIKALKEQFLNVSTLIENENTPMLKMAMKAGFRIIGIRNFKGKIYLEHLLQES